MAMTDYSVRATGNIAPAATLLTPVTPGDVTVTIIGFSAIGMTAPAVGAGCMLGGEILKVTSVSGMTLGVSRGCADTIPGVHRAGTPLFFLDNAFAVDQREYMATETIGVKLLAKTAGLSMEVKNSPPAPLTFNSRFARPYPPGAVLVNGDPWYTSYEITADDALMLTWAHRDRITQGDQLYGHEAGNIGPEAGTTYTVEVRKTDGTVVRTVDGISGTSWTYTAAVAASDLGGARTGRIRLRTMRDGYASWQEYEIPFTVAVDSAGWGFGWGFGWGG